MKNVLFLFLSLLLLQCNTKTTIETTKETMSGVFKGIVPCADCSGILTEISFKNGSFSKNETYLGESDKVFVTTGSYTINAATNMITLKPSSSEDQTTFLMKEGENLVLLDTKGSKITGDLATNYVLFPLESQSLLYTNWAGTHINGNTVKSGQVPSLMFEKNGRVWGTTSCNRLSGSFDQSGNNLKFKPLMVTKMMCMDNTTENPFLQAIEKTKSFKVVENVLTLFDENKKALLKFKRS